MPSLQNYKKHYNSNRQNAPHTTIGMAQKHNADMIMEQTWDRDIQSKIAYIYDY